MFKKECIECKKPFTPTGRSCKLCDICWVKNRSWDKRNKKIKGKTK